MALQTRIEPIDRDIALMLSEDLSPKAQSKVFAQFAGDLIEEAKQGNKLILGRVPRYTVSVDGRMGAALETVRPDGYVIAEFELFNDVLSWIGDQLVKHSPFKSGRYAKSHSIFADGVEVNLGAVIPNADEFVFINNQPYARKIERGQSSQAPGGVYQAVATLARRRFGNIAKIDFSYRTAISGNIIGGRAGDRSEQRNPAITVRLPR